MDLLLVESYMQLSTCKMHIIPYNLTNLQLLCELNTCKLKNGHESKRAKLHKIHGLKTINATAVLTSNIPIKMQFIPLMFAYFNEAELINQNAIYSVNVSIYQ